ncbi:MAG TPA: peptide deformylase [Candidatus Acidoferrum sp.]|nr:peptide deformylase [Candidatus Acidoferrum sp.]
MLSGAKTQEPLALATGYTRSTAMAYIRVILTDGHPTLRKVAKKVDPAEIADPMFQQLLDDMFATMYEAPGIGLAAPQIGLSKRIFVVDMQDEVEGHGPLVVINPKFVVREGERDGIEGCLSVPGKVGDVTRFDHVVVHGLDRHGKKITIDAEGYFAVCLQHENDHLDGVLYIDKARNIRDAITEEERAVAEAVAAEGEAIERVNDAAVAAAS